MKEKLIELRKEKGFLLKDVASALKISISTYSNYEQGIRQPSYDILKKISKFYNVSTDYLLGLEDEFGNDIDVDFESLDTNTLKIMEKSTRKKPRDKIDSKLIRMFDNLTPSQQESMLKIAKEFAKKDK